MSSLLTDYEEALIGKKPLDLTHHYQGNMNGGLLKQQAISCMKFALNTVLGWSISETRRSLDHYILKTMKLDNLLRYVPYPLEVPEGDIEYLLHLMYPTEIKLNEESLILRVYKKVLKGEMQFPKDYFVGGQGFYRMCVCIKYLIDFQRSIPDLEQLYQFYSSPAGNEFLRVNKLKIPIDVLDIEPLACIYELTKDESRSKFYYCFAEFSKKQH